MLHNLMSLKHSMQFDMYVNYIIQQQVNCGQAMIRAVPIPLTLSWQTKHHNMLLNNVIAFTN